MYRRIPDYNLVARSSADKSYVKAPGIRKDIVESDKPDEPQSPLTIAQTTQILRASKKANYRQFKKMRRQIS